MLAATVLHLVDRGSVKLDEPIVTYLPELKSDDARLTKVTVRHLLSHRSGLRNFSGYDWDNPDPQPDALRRFLMQPGRFVFTANPGKKYGYADLNYNLLGLLVQEVTSAPFNLPVENLSLIPNGATTAKLSCRQVPPSKVATGHVLSNGTLAESLIRPDNPPHEPSGGLCITAAELALRGRNVFDCRRPGSLPCDLAEEMIRKPEDGQYALGWNVEQTNGTRIAHHNGATPGFSSGLVVAPDQGIAVAVLGNSFYNSSELIARMLLNEELGIPSEPVSFPARSDWTRLEGYYYNAEWHCAQVRRTGTGLRVSFQYPFFPYERNEIHLIPKPDQEKFMGSFRGRFADLYDLNGEKKPKLWPDRKVFEQVPGPAGHCAGVERVEDTPAKGADGS